LLVGVAEELQMPTWANCAGFPAGKDDDHGDDEERVMPPSSQRRTVNSKKW